VHRFGVPENSLCLREQVYLARVKGRFPADLSHLRMLDSIDLAAIVTDEDLSTSTGSKRPIEEISPDDDLPALPAGRHLRVASKEEVGKSARVGYRILSSARSPSVVQSMYRVDSSDDTVYAIQCPINVVSHREGIHACDHTGKQSVSHFRMLGYDTSSDTSLIECRPLTGRTHQLRLHLQLCGHSIANDPCYGGELFYRDVQRKEQAITALVRMHRHGIKPLSNAHYVVASEELKAILAQPQEDMKDEEVSLQNEGLQEEMEAKQMEGESEDDFILRTCR
jgi:hypothetical protein